MRRTGVYLADELARDGDTLLLATRDAADDLSASAQPPIQSGQHLRRRSMPTRFHVARVASVDHVPAHFGVDALAKAELVDQILDALVALLCEPVHPPRPPTIRLA